MAISLGGGGSASVINETIDINSTENLITLEDGRVYLKGGVASTDLTTYPDATAELAYSGTSFSVASQAITPVGIAWDGTYFWVVGNVTDTIRKFNAAGVDQGVSYSVAAQATNPKGITFDGTYLWVVGTASGKAHKYNTSGVYQNESFAVNSQDTSTQGIVSIGTALWTIGKTTDAAYKYEKQIGIVARDVSAGGEGHNYVRIK